MSKKYAKKTSRSRRNRKDLRGEISGLDPAGRTVQLSLPIGEILEGMQGALEEVSQTAGLLIMKALIDDEVARLALAGERGKHGSSSVRWGQEESHLVLNGKKHAYSRPRVRRRSGKEVSLMEETVAKQVVLGHRSSPQPSGRQRVPQVDPGLASEFPRDHRFPGKRSSRRSFTG